MNTSQKTVAGIVVVAVVGLACYQGREAIKLRREVQVIREEERQEVSALTEQVKSLERQRDKASNQVAELTHQMAERPKSLAEAQKLRGEVGRLRRENADIGSSSPLSRVTSNPESVKLLREQQKMGMGMLYQGLAKNGKLAPDQTQKLNELLADHIMENVHHVTTALRDKPTPEQMNQVFATQEATLNEDVRNLLGDDGMAKYQDYTRQLLSKISGDQFKSMLTGADAAREDKARQLSDAIQQSVDEVIAQAGLPADYQALPILNFRNIASEQEGDRALKLLDDIYQRAGTRSAGFLSPEEVTKFQEFRTTAINNSRAALAINRSMMAPIGQ